MSEYSVLRLIANTITGHANWRRAWRDPEPRKSYDVIIVGGGGHGLATAFYLAKNHRVGSIAVLEWLVKEKGFDVNAEDKYGNRPIHTCGWAGDKEVVDWLEQNGADLNAKNKYGHTASDKAARDGKWEMLQYLVDEKGIELGAYETFGR